MNLLYIKVYCFNYTEVCGKITSLTFTRQRKPFEVGEANLHCQCLGSIDWN